MAEHDQSFKNEIEWECKASSWLTRHPKYHDQFFRAICFDSTGKICKNGEDFMSAIYPVYWIWPDQNLFNFIDSIPRKQND